MKTEQIVVLAHFYDDVEEDGTVEPNDTGRYNTTPRLYGVYDRAQDAELALNLEIQSQEQQFLAAKAFARISGFTIMSAAYPEGNWVSVYKTKNPKLARVQAMAKLSRKSKTPARKEKA